MSAGWSRRSAPWTGRARSDGDTEGWQGGDRQAERGQAGRERACPPHGPPRLPPHPAGPEGELAWRDGFLCCVPLSPAFRYIFLNLSCPLKRARWNRLSVFLLLVFVLFDLVWFCLFVCCFFTAASLGTWQFCKGGGGGGRRRPQWKQSTKIRKKIEQCAYQPREEASDKIIHKIRPVLDCSNHTATHNHGLPQRVKYSSLTLV